MRAKQKRARGKIGDNIKTKNPALLRAVIYRLGFAATLRWFD